MGEAAQMVLTPGIITQRRLETQKEVVMSSEPRGQGHPKEAGTLVDLQKKRSHGGHIVIVQEHAGGQEGEGFSSLLLYN